MPRKTIRNRSRRSGKLQPFKYVCKQETKVELHCRICFTTSSNEMYNLLNKFSSDDCSSKITQMTIQEGLEKVTASKINLDVGYPDSVCPDCVSILKIALKFIFQFEETQNKLNSLFIANGIELTQLDSNIVENMKNVTIESPVEITFGSQKFGLNELLVVEKDEEDKSNFQGFLSNLGKDISASFVKKPTNKGKSDQKEQVTISLVEKDKISIVQEVGFDENTNLVKYIVIENNESNDASEEILTLKIEGDNEDDKEAKVVEDKKIRAKNQVKTAGNNKKIVILDIKNIKINGANDGYEVRYPCEICKKVFDLPEQLRAHKNRSHSVSSKVFRCNICGYQNNTASGYKHHQNKHLGKKWSCDVCLKSYYTKAVLKIHMASHTNERKHLCTVCGKSFNYSNALVYHMRLHTGEKNYVCMYCGLRFRMSNALNRHLRCHTGERPYKCCFCDKAFRSKGELGCHESGHTGHKPYHCKYCKKGFLKTHNLKLHLLSHGGPHKCDMCGRNFIEAEILTMHQKISHKDSENTFDL